MFQRKVTWLAAVVSLIPLIPWTSTEAATVEAMTLDEMARRAEMVFIGRVTGSRADWNVQRTRIYTYVRFEVDKFLKGGAGEREVTIRLWGGRVGGFTSLVPGTPRFVLGEEVLLFCAGSRARMPMPLGLSLGKFTIKRDSAGEAILNRDISGLLLTHYRTDSRPVGAPPTRYRLSEVEARIQAALVN